MEILSNKGKRCFLYEYNKFISYRKDPGGNEYWRCTNKWMQSTSDDVERQRTESLLLLHTLTIADRFLQDRSFSRKYAIVMDQELICE